MAIHRAHLPALFLSILAFVAMACSKSEAPLSTHTSAAIPKRVVVIGPATAANIFALGVGDLVVGVSDYNTLDAAAALPRVGGLFDPNLERIAALAPDLLIVQGQARSVEQFCRPTGIEFRSFSTDTLDAWRAEMKWLAERLGAQEELPRQLERMEQGLQELADAHSTQPQPRVLLVISRRTDEASGIMVAGGRSFLNELLSYAGGQNVFPDNNRDYFDLNEESLVRAAPEIILEFGTNPETALQLWRAAFPQVPAVRDGRVYGIPNHNALMPGPSMLETARSLAAAINE